MKSNLTMVRDWHLKYGQPVRTTPSAEPVTLDERDLRWNLLQEEVDELLLAMKNGDVVEVADALADILYVTHGTALHYGIDLDAVFEEVHRSNMTKTYDPSRAKYAGKVIVKGDDFEPPRIADVLSRTATGETER